ncbi:MAG: hypothetical protein AMK71_08700 [Nitrospira bacterium SG8_35_4]|nr:MAG: hypothetical protein AMK71_08700 [Nitrospira bacterium SG8_35_4]
MRKKVILISVILLIQCGASHAQVLRPLEPGAVQQRSADTLKYYRFEKKLKEEKKKRADEEKVVEEEEKVKPLPPEVADRVIFISKIETGPSEILSEEEIRAIIAPYEGREANISDIFALLDQLNKLYSAENVITAKAVLPPQKVEDGVIRIKLIEAHLGSVQIEGNQYTRSSYFQKRISLERGELVDIDALKNDLLYFNRTNDVAMRAELKAGEEFGLTDFVLKVYEPTNYYVSVFVDNAGREEVGRERIGVNAGSLSLLGIRDPLSLSGYISDGTISGSLAYNIPITSSGTRLGVLASYTDIEITSGPFVPLNITGDSYDVAITLSHPIIVMRRYDITGFAEYHVKESTTNFDDVTLFDTEGDSLPFGIEYQSFGHNFDITSRWYATFGSYDNQSVSDDFFKVNADATGILSIQNIYSTVLKAGAQITDAELLPSFEQFQIGGLATVRGFDDGALIGDQGYFLSAELNFPFSFLKAGDITAKHADNIRGFVFLDHGGVVAFKGPAAGSGDFDMITSTGFGVTFSLSKYLMGKLIFGLPVDSPPNIDDDPKFHFYLQSNIL